MATRATDTSYSEEEIDYIYILFFNTECDSDFAEYINTCEPEYSKEELGKLGNYFLNFILSIELLIFLINYFYVRFCGSHKH